MNDLDDLSATNARLVDAAASREHELLRLQDRVNEMQAERIAGVSHAMLDRAFVRDDRDLLLQLRDRLRASTEDWPMQGEDPERAKGRARFARELLALYPDDLL